MKTLTIRSPWAQYIIRDGKDVENRSWPVSYRGPLLVHCSRRPASSESGMIIGMVDLVDCCPPCKKIQSRWAESGLYHWILKNPRELFNKIPVRGKLSLWEFDLDITRQVWY